MNINKLLNTKTGSIVVSIILGLGLAALFRRACKNNSCIVIKGPKMEDVNNFYYKINHECYKYKPVISECDL
jgi:hypothetical protein